MADSKPKTASERKAQERKRKRASGLVPVEVWIRSDKRLELAREVERLNDER